MNFIPAQYYYYIYLTLVLILTLYLLNSQTHKVSTMTLVERSHVEANWSWLYLALFFALFVGLRPTSKVFVDMLGYARLWFWSIHNYTGWNAQNIIFDGIPFLLNKFGLGYIYFFVFIALIYFVGTAYAMKRLLGRNALIGYVVWLAAFSTFSYATNGIKAGAAATLFLLAISFYDRKWIAAIFLLLSFGFHHSMRMPVGVFILCLFLERPKAYFWFWVVCLVLAASGVTSIMTWLGEMLKADDEHGANYLLINNEYGARTGFRPDFVLYSAVPVALGYWVIFKKKFNSKAYTFFWSVYVVINAFWLLCMNASFTNRIAYLSWCIYPLVIIYPFLTKQFMVRQIPMMRTVVTYNLLFTIFMTVIYYQFIHD